MKTRQVSPVSPQILFREFTLSPHFAPNWHLDFSFAEMIMESSSQSTSLDPPQPNSLISKNSIRFKTQIENAEWLFDAQNIRSHQNRRRVYTGIWKARVISGSP